jgi:hypothetical protein
MGDIDWAKVYERLYGHPLGTPVPPETEVIEQAADSLSDSLLEKGPLVLRQLSVEIQTAGLPAEAVPFLLSLLDEGSDNWPPMSPSQQLGLNLAISVLKESGSFPSIEMTTLPSLQYDKAFNDVMKNLGTWGETKFLGEFVRAYAAVIKRYQKAFSKVVPLIPKGSEGAILSIYLRHAIKNRPFNYQFGHLLKKAIKLMFE